MSNTPRKPQRNDNLTNIDIMLGIPIPPLDRLKIMSDKQFEELTLEWIDGYLNNQYFKVEQFGGAGDKGRDVVGYQDTDFIIWDNYQCKHYDHPLSPSEIWVEFGKIIYYSFIKDYNPPRKYYFVTPNGIGPKLADLLRSPSDIKKQLLENWNSKCKTGITKTNDVVCSAELTDYINSFDFGIFDYIPPIDLITQHRETIYYPARFGGGLIKKRPESKLPTSEIKEYENRYVEQLYEAYQDKEQQTISCENDLSKKYPRLHNHFNQQRISFYSADSLFEFSKDALPSGIAAFDKLKEEVFNGVIDVHNMDYSNAYERLLNTVQESVRISITNNPLCSVINNNDRKGICHHLANIDRLKWKD